MDGTTLKHLRQKMQALQEESSKTTDSKKEVLHDNLDIFEKTSEISKNRAERRSKLVKRKK